MTTLSENSKLRFESPLGKMGFDQDQTRSNEPPHLEETEAQMRRALGLFGDMSRRQESERSDSPQRPADRLTPGGHRRRFVQDGDVPVTVVRRDNGADIAANRASSVSPTSSRLQRTEAALASETAARDRAERALAEAQAVVRDLQTKIGHAELAKNEALEALRREREEVAAFRASVSDVEARLRDATERAELAERAAALANDASIDDRNARIGAERAARQAAAAREAADERANDLARQVPEAAPVVLELTPRAATRTPDAIALPSVRRSRTTSIPEPDIEPEPVKWWLTTAKSASKRR